MLPDSLRSATKAELRSLSSMEDRNSEDESLDHDHAMQRFDRLVDRPSSALPLTASSPIASTASALIINTSTPKPDRGLTVPSSPATSVGMANPRSQNQTPTPLSPVLDEYGRPDPFRHGVDFSADPTLTGPTTPAARPTVPRPVLSPMSQDYLPRLRSPGPSGYRPRFASGTGANNALPGYSPGARGQFLRPQVRGTPHPLQNQNFLSSNSFSSVTSSAITFPEPSAEQGLRTRSGLGRPPVGPDSVARPEHPEEKEADSAASLVDTVAPVVEPSRHQALPPPPSIAAGVGPSAARSTVNELIDDPHNITMSTQDAGDRVPSPDFLTQPADPEASSSLHRTYSAFSQKLLESRLSGRQGPSDTSRLSSASSLESLPALSKAAAAGRLREKRPASQTAAVQPSRTVVTRLQSQAGETLERSVSSPPRLPRSQPSDLTQPARDNSLPSDRSAGGSDDGERLTALADRVAAEEHAHRPASHFQFNWDRPFRTGTEDPDQLLSTPSKVLQMCAARPEAVTAATTFPPTSTRASAATETTTTAEPIPVPIPLATDVARTPYRPDHRTQSRTPLSLASSILILPDIYDPDRLATPKFANQNGHYYLDQATPQPAARRVPSQTLQNTLRRGPLRNPRLPGSDLSITGSPRNLAKQSTVTPQKPTQPAPQPGPMHRTLTGVPIEPQSEQLMRVLAQLQEHYATWSHEKEELMRTIVDLQRQLAGAISNRNYTPTPRTVPHHTVAAQTSLVDTSTGGVRSQSARATPSRDAPSAFNDEHDATDLTWYLPDQPLDPPPAPETQQLIDELNRNLRREGALDANIEGMVAYIRDLTHQLAAPPTEVHGTTASTSEALPSPLASSASSITSDRQSLDARPEHPYRERLVLRETATSARSTPAAPTRRTQLVDKLSSPFPAPPANPIPRATPPTADSLPAATTVNEAAMAQMLEEFRNGFKRLLRRGSHISRSRAEARSDEKPRRRRRRHHRNERPSLADDLPTLPGYLHRGDASPYDDDALSEALSRVDLDSPGSSFLTEPLTSVDGLTEERFVREAHRNDDRSSPVVLRDYNTEAQFHAALRREIRSRRQYLDHQRPVDQPAEGYGEADDPPAAAATAPPVKRHRPAAKASVPVDESSYASPPASLLFERESTAPAHVRRQPSAQAPALLRRAVHMRDMATQVRQSITATGLHHRHAEAPSQPSLPQPIPDHHDHYNNPNDQPRVEAPRLRSVQLTPTRVLMDSTRSPPGQHPSAAEEQEALRRYHAARMRPHTTKPTGGTPRHQLADRHDSDRDSVTVLEDDDDHTTTYLPPTEGNHSPAMLRKQGYQHHASPPASAVASLNDHADTHSLAVNLERLLALLQTHPSAHCPLCTATPAPVVGQPPVSKLPSADWQAWFAQRSQPDHAAAHHHQYPHYDHGTACPWADIRRLLSDLRHQPASPGEGSHLADKSQTGQHHSSPIAAAAAHSRPSLTLATCQHLDRLIAEMEADFAHLKAKYRVVVKEYDGARSTSSSDRTRRLLGTRLKDLVALMDVKSQQLVALHEIRHATPSGPASLSGRRGKSRPALEPTVAIPTQQADLAAGPLMCPYGCTAQAPTVAPRHHHQHPGCTACGQNGTTLRNPTFASHARAATTTSALAPAVPLRSGAAARSAKSRSATNTTALATAGPGSPANQQSGGVPGYQQPLNRQSKEAKNYALLKGMQWIQQALDN
ncbi:hypothetical protein IWQ60_006335 [Tieghemiomyces parasiticus]|uniref:Cep57 centrosome microtubule-binding domain-containing protein n=1 Tax=Tieghemiomyces parasiticus TaxID=78921 RepID=A0A9W8A4I9_9FUNG|nr:hypothetical protein IWQ60_006335 [Tieghemiomyces parasiticus]